MGQGSIKYTWLGLRQWSLTKWGTYMSKDGSSRNGALNKVWGKCGKVKVCSMKYHTLLQAMSSLQA